MRLASLRDGTRDGRLLLVSADLSRAVEARAASTLLVALETWDVCEPLLRDQARRLQESAENSFAFDPGAVLAPLPRAPQWLDASAYRTHSELVCEAWQTPNPFSDEMPLMYQGASDDFLPAHGPSYLPDEAHNIDLEAEVAIVVDEVPMGVDTQAALSHIKLVMLANDVSLRAFGPREMQSGFGFLQAKPSTVFSPVAVTVDDLGNSWQHGRLHRPVMATINRVQIGAPNASHMTESGRSANSRARSASPSAEMRWDSRSRPGARSCSNSWTGCRNPGCSCRSSTRSGCSTSHTSWAGCSSHTR